jgi:aminoglycoside phosphotransferase (APT) family kinase protein
MAFYRARTEARISRAERHLSKEERGPGLINRMPVPRVQELLAGVPWELLSEGRPSFIHGDLQLDNVIECADRKHGRFRLIDWRQDFAGSLHQGDLYYDFAKLLASVELDFRAVARGEFHVEAGSGLKIVAPVLPGAERLRSLVEEFAVRRQGLDLARLHLHVALVYLSMAGLHLSEESRFLFHLGRLRLFESLMQGQWKAQPKSLWQSPY